MRVDCLEARGDCTYEFKTKSSTDNLLHFRSDQCFHHADNVFLPFFSTTSFENYNFQNDLALETSRLITFKTFPHSAQASALRLAQNGFYYTGQGDKVKCFSCGVTYQGWIFSDRPNVIHARIQPSCLMAFGKNKSNSPLSFPTTERRDLLQAQRFTKPVSSGLCFRRLLFYAENDAHSDVTLHTGRGGKAEEDEEEVYDLAHSH